MTGDVNALGNPLVGSRKRRAGGRHRSGVGAIAVFIPLVREVSARHDNLLFHQSSAMHDLAVRQWRVLLSKPILWCTGAAAGIADDPGALIVSYSWTSAVRLLPKASGLER
jgi:hypothetical protein